MVHSEFTRLMEITIYSKNVILLNHIKYHFPKSYKDNTFCNLIVLTYFYYY